MRASRFFRQAITLKRLVSRDDYAGSSYAEPETIYARWSDKPELVRGNDGVEVTTSARVSTLEALSVGDRLLDASGTEREVVSVGEARDVRGGRSHVVARVA